MTTIGQHVFSATTWNPAGATGTRTFDYIDLSCVDQNLKQVTGSSKVMCRAAPSRARQLVISGDILVSTVRPNLNSVAVVPEHLEGATASTGFTVLRPKPRLDGRYLFHWVRSPEFVSDMTRKATGASYPAVSDSVVKESHIPLPPVSEQRRIAAILDQADALRAKRCQTLALLGDLAQSIFLDMFGGAAEAEFVQLGDVSNVQGGLQVTTRRASLPVEVPYLRVANVHRGGLDLTELKTIRASQAEVSRTRLQLGDLLVVEGHGNRDEVGRGAVWEGGVELCVHQNHLIRVRLDKRQVLPVFAVTWLNSPAGRRYWVRVGKTTSGLNTINTSNVKAAPLMLPPMRLQTDFGVRIAGIDRQRRKAIGALALSDALFSSVQVEAFAHRLSDDRHAALMGKV